jgi:hypothetical protein
MRSNTHRAVKVLEMREGPVLCVFITVVPNLIQSFDPENEEKKSEFVSVTLWREGPGLRSLPRGPCWPRRA